MQIEISTEVNASLANVWRAWVNPEDVIHWNFASDDWCCPTASSEFIENGRFNYRMEAKDGSFGFDFEGTFSQIKVNELIRYRMDDEREVTITFQSTEKGVLIIETFDAEDQHSAEQQKDGWHSILLNFKAYVESAKK